MIIVKRVGWGLLPIFAVAVWVVGIVYSPVAVMSFSCTLVILYVAHTIGLLMGK